jgi:hypothetical protein
MITRQRAACSLAAGAARHAAPAPAPGCRINGGDYVQLADAAAAEAAAAERKKAAAAAAAAAPPPPLAAPADPNHPASSDSFGEGGALVADGWAAGTQACLGLGREAPSPDRHEPESASHAAHAGLRSCSPHNLACTINGEAPLRAMTLNMRN